MCTLCVNTLLKDVSHYDLSVLSMSAMGFQKSLYKGWVGGWGELYPVLFWIFLLSNFAKFLRWSVVFVIV